MINMKCQLCAEDNSQLIQKEEKWDIVQCLRCGFVYVNPQPTQSYLNTHYQQYLPMEQSEIATWEKMMSGVFAKSVKIIEQNILNRQIRLLDIGCGHGFFLKVTKAKGWNVSGIDLSEPAVKWARANGLDAATATLFEKKYSEAEFDVISMFYVLEHLPDPIEYLQEILRILKPGGLLLVRVPHTTPIVKILKFLHILNKLYDAPSHLNDFSPQTLEMILRKTGFRNIDTMIGGTTYPKPIMEKITACFFGGLAEVLFKMSWGRYLLPGVSKTTIAIKPLNK